MAYNLFVLYFSLAAIFQLGLISYVQSRAFIMDDFKDYVDAQTRHQDNELQKFIKVLKASFTHRQTSHTNKFDKLTLKLMPQQKNATKLTKITKNRNTLRLNPVVWYLKNKNKINNMHTISQR